VGGALVCLAELRAANALAAVFFLTAVVALVGGVTDR